MARKAAFSSGLEGAMKTARTYSDASRQAVCLIKFLNRSIISFHVAFAVIIR